MQQHKDYSHFTESEFLCDEHFQNWILRPDDANNAFWENWIKQHPEKEDMVRRTKELLQNIGFKEHWPDEEGMRLALESALASLEDERRPGLLRRMGGLRKIAAVFAGLCVITIAVYLMTGRNIVKEYATGYGMVDTVYLPDQSMVVLNGNSKIKYDKKWTGKKAREVWLEGEAFFNVMHLNMDTTMLKPEERFLVHTNDLTVEVLGTTFNVRQRRSSTEVVLLTGKINVILKNGQSTRLEPGYALRYSASADQLSYTSRVPENYSSWTSKKLTLINPTADNIIQYLEDNYGKKIILLDKRMGKTVVEGPIDIDNLDDALFILSLVLNVEIIREDSTTLVFKPRALKTR